jgi:hypothetical protein
MLTGTIADGLDSPELLQQVNGNFVSLDPPVRYRKGQEGGSYRTKALPAGSFRWSVPGSGHSVSTRIIAG